jgi:hypothetical protein
LVIHTASGGFDAICRAVTSARSSSASGSTTSSTSPISRASATSNVRPVSISSAERDAPTSRGSR